MNIKCVNYTKLSNYDLNLILSWRNSDRIRTRMTEQKVITQQEHLKWVYTLRTKLDCVHFLIYFGSNPVGIFNLKNINFAEKTCMGGAYLGNEEFKRFGTIICLLGHIYCFDKLNLEKHFAKILKTNQRIYEMHKKVFFAKDMFCDDSKEYYNVVWDLGSWEQIKALLLPKIKTFYEINKIEFE